MTAKAFLYLTSIFIFMVIIGCSGEEKDNGNSEEQKLIGDAQHQEQNKQSGFDISKIKPCELVPDQLLEQTIDAKIIKPTSSSDYGSTKGCTYIVDPQGKDMIENIIIWITPPSTFLSLDEDLETAKGLGQEATGENLEGLGDKAFVVHNKTEEQSIIHVLLKNKLALQVGADHFDDVRKITELFLSKLKDIN